MIAANSATFKVKDYLIEGLGRHKTMTLSPGEFSGPVPDAVDSPAAVG